MKIPFFFYIYKNTVLISKNIKEHEMRMKLMINKSEEYGLKINWKKTKIMLIGDVKEKFEDQWMKDNIEVVEEFNYLGAMINSKNDCSNEIKRRLSMAKKSMTDLQVIFKDKAISKRTKIRLVKTLIHPIELYGAETWTIKKREEERIRSFELWCWRRMLRVSWTEKRTNESIVREIGEKMGLMNVVKQRILRYYGHIVRMTGRNLEKTIMQGKMEGCRQRGRPRPRWIDQIRTYTGKTSGMCKEDGDGQKVMEKDYL